MPAARTIDELISSTKVLVVDDEFYTRKVIRTLLWSIGVTDVRDANDGASGLEAVRSMAPDIVLLDWEMPGMNGAEFMRRVRAPGEFPYPDVPIIILTGHGERSRVLEAMRLGVHEFLLKPVSGRTLHSRLVSVLARPRQMVKQGAYYGPQPRQLSNYSDALESFPLQPDPMPPGDPDIDPDSSNMVFID
jgi:two-component system, chemotaxis family, chemotaxis protein CheY